LFLDFSHSLSVSKLLGLYSFDIIFLSKEFGALLLNDYLISVYCFYTLSVPTTVTNHGRKM